MLIIKTSTLLLICCLIINIQYLNSFIITSSSSLLLLSLSTNKKDINNKLFAGFGKKDIIKNDNQNKKKPPLDGTIEDCKCGSGKKYSECCQKFHQSYPNISPNPVELVRSRFCALCYNIPNYMIQTTHPKHKEYALEEQQSKYKNWIKSLNSFSTDYDFLELTFDNEQNDCNPPIDSKEAFVSFSCKLKETSTGKLEEMKERSLFMKSDQTGAWLYRDAEVTNPFKNKKTDDDVKPVQRKMITTLKKGVPKSN